MRIFKMDNIETIRWILTGLVGLAGWLVAFGRKVITTRVIDEVSKTFVRRDIYDLEMKNVQASITALTLEQKANHADMINRLEKSFEQINKKIEMLVQ